MVTVILLVLVAAGGAMLCQRKIGAAMRGNGRSASLGRRRNYEKK